MVNHVGKFINIKLVELGGVLSVLVDLGSPMVSRVKAVVASSAFDYTLHYSLVRTPGSDQGVVCARLGGFQGRRLVAVEVKIRMEVVGMERWEERHKVVI